MRITGIHIENFLSFGSFDWPDLNTQINVVVGPNGSGKTNLFHAIRAAVDSLDLDSSLGASLSGLRYPRARWEQAVHRSSGRRSFTIGLDLELTSDWEKGALAALVGAALCEYQDIQRELTRVENRINPTNDDVERFSVPVLAMLQANALDWMHQGRFSVEYDGAGGWATRYQSLPASPHPFRWELESRRTASGLFGPTVQNGTVSFFEAWRNSLAETDKTLLDSFFAQSATGDLPKLDLLMVMQNTKHGLKVEASGQPNMLFATHRTLEELFGLKLEHSHRYDGRWLFAQFLRRAFIFTNNVRKTPQSTFTLIELTNTQPIDLTNGAQLALDLFRKKNGDQDARKRYLAVQLLFHRVSGRDFDVVLNSSISSTPTAAGKARTVELELRTAAPFGDIPLAFSGAGVGEALFLSTLIEGTEDCVVMLDEPALSLHPTTQATVIKEIERRGHSQFIVVTHASLMIPGNAIEQVSRFFLQEGATFRAAPDWKALGSKKRITIRQEFGGNGDVRPLLFSRGVILVEGRAELVSLPLWYEKKFGAPLEESDLKVYWVTGYPNFEKNARLLSGFGVPWVMVYDGDAIKGVATQLRRLGVPHAPNPEKLDLARDFEEFRRKLASTGAFTMANAPTESFETFIETKYKPDAPAEVKGSNVSLARWAAENHDCPPEVSELFEQIESYFDRVLMQSPRTVL